MNIRIRVMALFLLSVLGLSACGGNREPPAGSVAPAEPATVATEASSAATEPTQTEPTPAPTTAPTEESSEPAEKSGWAWSSPWGLNMKAPPATLETMEYWEVQLRYLYSGYPKEYEWNSGDPDLRKFPALLIRDGILSVLERDAVGSALLDWEDFEALLALYYGPNVAEKITPENFEKTGLGDGSVKAVYQDGVITIPWNSTLLLPYDRSDFELAAVTPLDESYDRVELIANRYAEFYRAPGGEERVLSEKVRYMLRWDGVVGYVVESASWDYVPTDRVSFGGNVRELADLWGMEPTGYAEQSYEAQSDSMGDDYLPSRGDSLYVHGEVARRFYTEGNAILYDALNLETLEQSTGHTLLAAESEPSSRVWRVGEGIAVFADGALHQFDGALNPVRTVPVPRSVPITERGVVIDERFESLAYCVEDDLYLYEFAGGEPRRIYTHVYPDEQWLDGQFNSFYPVRFTAEGDLFVGISGWEASAIQYLLISREGKTLADVNWPVTGIYNGGYCFSNAAGAIHHYPYGQGVAEWHYLGFSSHTPRDMRNIPFGFSGMMGMMAVPAAQTGSRWYFSEPIGPEQLPDETVFYQVDFGAGTMAELPLRVNGARAALMAVSDSGRMLFSYAYLGERGFGVYEP